MRQTFREDIINLHELPSALQRAPGELFTHPHQVLGHPALSTSEKRALLAEWASDACAVEGRPAWRQIPWSGAVVGVDDILDALQVLDHRQS